MRKETRDFLEAAGRAAKLSNCVQRQVGAVLVSRGVVIASGWSGVHEAAGKSCVDAGCPRCGANIRVSGMGYESCICMHAEATAIATAAKKGIRLRGAVLYSSSRPCVQCTSLILAAGIRRIYYSEDWRYEVKQLERLHKKLRSSFSVYRALRL